MKKITLFLTLLVAMVSTAMAQLQDGAVYRIVNKSKSSSISVNSTNVIPATINELAAEQLWVLGKGSKEGTYSLKNISTNTYISYINQYYAGWPTSPTAVDFYIGVQKTEDGVDYQYISFSKIENTDNSKYTCAHDDGNGKIVMWENKADASLWKFVKVFDTEDEINGFTVTYNFKYNGKVAFTQQNVVLAGAGYPAITVRLPYGVSVVDNTLPEGTVNENVTKDFELQTAETPFTVSSLTNGEFGDDMHWYTMKIQRNPVEQIRYNESSNTAVTDNGTPIDNTVYNLFAFTGNYVDGFTIYNYAAGASKVFMRENADNNQSVYFTEPNDNTWFLEPNGTSGWVFRFNGSETGYMNDVQNTVGIWNHTSAAKDAGSTFLFEEVTGDALKALEDAYMTPIDVTFNDGEYYMIYTEIDGVEHYLVNNNGLGWSLTQEPVYSWKITKQTMFGTDFDQFTMKENVLGMYGNTIQRNDKTKLCSILDDSYQQYYTVENGQVVTSETADYCWKIRAGYPFALTLEGANPILYRIKSGRTQYRDGNNEWYWTNNADKVELASTGKYAEKNYWWYFVEQADKNVKIYSHADKSHISVANTVDGSGKANLQDETGSDEHNTWSVKVVNGKYGFRTDNEVTYLSHNGGFANENYTMGLYAGDPNNDTGTQVSFEELGSYNLEITSAGWATLYLNHAVAIPTDVTAYIVTGTTNTHALLQEVSGTIPAKTGLILNKENGGTYVLGVSYDDATAIEGNLLKGTLTTTDIAPATGTTYYILANGEVGVGLYPDGLSDNDEGVSTFRNNANKAYLPLTGAANSAGLRFEFGTTGIENVESAVENAVYYDLSGRRVENPVKGIYIVNGKKVLVK